MPSLLVGWMETIDNAGLPQMFRAQDLSWEEGLGPELSIAIYVMEQVRHFLAFGVPRKELLGNLHVFDMTFEDDRGETPRSSPISLACRVLLATLDDGHYKRVQTYSITDVDWAVGMDFGGEGCADIGRRDMHHFLKVVLPNYNNSELMADYWQHFSTQPNPFGMVLGMALKILRNGPGKVKSGMMVPAQAGWIIGQQQKQAELRRDNPIDFAKDYGSDDVEWGTHSTIQGCDGTFAEAVHGNGVFTRRGFKKGEAIIPKVAGILCLSNQAESLSRDDPHEPRYYITPKRCDLFRLQLIPRTLASFVNHSQEPNAECVEIGECGLGAWMFRALRKIPAGEEITMHYGVNAEEEHFPESKKTSYPRTLILTSVIVPRIAQKPEKEEVSVVGEDSGAEDTHPSGREEASVKVCY